jgi:putative transposase
LLIKIWNKNISFKQVIRQHGLPDKVTIDKSEANTAALDALNDEPNCTIEVD